MHRETLLVMDELMKSAENVESRFVIACDATLWPVEGSSVSVHASGLISQQQNVNSSLPSAVLTFIYLITLLIV